MVQLRDCFPFWKALTKEQQNTMEESAVKRTFEKGLFCTRERRTVWA